VTQPATCGAFGIRQQIGHFLYVIDPVNRRVVVMNSNRMSVLTSIPQPDPTDLAVSADYNILAVSNFSTNQVQFINTDPLSQNFLKVIQITPVGSGPQGISANQDGEDYLVCNSLSNSVSIIDGQSRKVRKTVSNQLAAPFQVITTPRQVNFGFNTGVYFAYIINKFGNVAIYESGPSGVQGFGFDDIIGAVTQQFPFATAMQADISALNSAVWILHHNTLGQAVASNLALTTSPVGPLPLVQFFFFPVPSFRQREWTIVQQVQPDQISGFAPRDIAFDDTNNIGAQLTFMRISVSGYQSTPIQHSAKSMVRPVPGGFTNVNNPKAMMFSNFDTGTIDVIGTATLLKLIEPVSAPGVQVLSSYWRQ
jgi:YVTN family beta-propeller protein